MKKSLKWLLITIGVILVGLLIYLIIKDALREEAELTFPDTIVVQNATNLDVDRTAKALMYNVFQYDTMKVVFIKMLKNVETMGDLDLLAYIVKNRFENKSYMIFLSSKVTESNLKKVLSHEFIHLNQMEDKRLIQFPPDQLMAVWKGDTIDLRTVVYQNRPHEIDAFKLDDKVYQQLDRVLYK